MDLIEEMSAAWAREHPDQNVRALIPIIRLTRLGELVETFQQEVLTSFQLTVSDYAVLAALRANGKPYALNPSQLYTRLGRSSGGMTKILKRLEERALIQRSRDPDDGRGAIVSLSQRGVALEDRAFAALSRASDQLLESLSETELDSANHCLRSLLECIESRSRPER